MRKKCRRDSPWDTPLFQGLLFLMVGLLGVDYLVIAAGDVAACYVLELLAGLEKEMA